LYEPFFYIISVSITSYAEYFFSAYLVFYI